MIKWYEFVFIWLLISIFVVYEYHGRLFRDFNECWFRNQECWVNYNGYDVYGGFWCDCENYKSKLRENNRE